MFQKSTICLWAANIIFVFCILTISLNGAAADGEDSILEDIVPEKGFYVVTAVFNPTSFKRDYDLYYKFAAHMNETGANLITIECLFPALNQSEFEVTDSNNPNHIQLQSKSIYWMKENLFNIAVEKLPVGAKWVAWLDADIIFEERNWISLTIKELEKYLVVQIFEKANFLGTPPQNKVLRTEYSFGYSVVHGKHLEDPEGVGDIPHTGYGWAMDFESFREMGGLPEMDILQGGDLHFAFSLLNKIPKAIEDNVNGELLQNILRKSDIIFTNLDSISKSENKKMVGYVPITISHDWHGLAGNSVRIDQWKILKAHNFNYNTDVTKTEDGLLILLGSETTNANGSRTLQEDCLSFLNKRIETEIKCLLEESNGNNENGLNKSPTLLFNQYRLGAQKRGFQDNYETDSCPIHPNPYSITNDRIERSEREINKLIQLASACK